MDKPQGLKFKRRRSTLPGPCEPSTIDLEELNYRIRNGNGCFLPSIGTSIFFAVAKNIDNFCKVFLET